MFAERSVAEAVDEELAAAEHLEHCLVELALDLDGDRLYAFGMNTPNTVYTGSFDGAPVVPVQPSPRRARG